MLAGLVRVSQFPVLLFEVADPEAWDQRRSDLAGVADELADVDRQVAEINQRIDQLLAMATTL